MVRYAVVIGWMVAVLSISAVPTEAGLQHRYSFNGNANDSVGGAHGTLVNNTGGAGYGGGQLALGNNGTQTGGASGSPNYQTNGDYVDLPNGIISALGNQATFEGWVAWGGPGSSPWQRIFEFGNSQGGEDVADTGDPEHFVFMTPRSSYSGGRYEFRYRDGRNGGSAENRGVWDSSALPVGQKTHVALVWDGNTSGKAALYRDGRLVGYNDLHFALSELNDVNNWLGRAQYFNGPNFAGSYDEFRIYDKALTPMEVYFSEKAGPDDPGTTGHLIYNPISLTGADQPLNYDTTQLPGGDETLGGVPFDVPATGNDAWLAGSGTDSLTVPVNVDSPVAVYTLINTHWGETNPGAYASIVFTATDGTTLVEELDGSDDIRNHYGEPWLAPPINNISSVQVVSVLNASGNREWRLDMQEFILPDEWLGKTLASVTLQNFFGGNQGGSGVQNVFLAGLTVASVPEPAGVTLAVFGFVGLLLLWRRR